MTVATLGLIIGGIIAGPVAEYLIKRNNLRSQAVSGATIDRAEQAGPISTVGTIGALAGILAAVVAGRWLAAKFSGGTITIPAFLWACCSAWRSATWCHSPVCAWTIAHLT